MARKLVIENTVKVPVKFSLNNNGKTTPFSLTLICDRLEQAEIKSRSSDGEKTAREFLTDVIKGWEGQKLIVEDDGTPADFDDESCEMLLNTAGVAMVIYIAYLKECGAKEKN